MYGEKVILARRQYCQLGSGTVQLSIYQPLYLHICYPVYITHMIHSAILPRRVATSQYHLLPLQSIFLGKQRPDIGEQEAKKIRIERLRTYNYAEQFMYIVIRTELETKAFIIKPAALFICRLKLMKHFYPDTLLRILSG